MTSAVVTLDPTRRAARRLSQVWLWMRRHNAPTSSTSDMSAEQRRPGPSPPADQDLAMLLQEARRGLRLATRAVEKIEAAVYAREDLRQ